MQLNELTGQHLTYCTNVHPGESLAEVEALVHDHVLDVKRRVSPDAPFGVGLRLAASAAFELNEPGAALRFASSLRERELYCFTINGFPYGTFHGKRVKEDVYLPDWLDPERARYTVALGSVLAQLLPTGMVGSISTAPGCFKPKAEQRPDAAARMAAEMTDVVAAFVELERATGKRIALALEPEPHCFLETTAEAIAFFEGQLFTAAAVSALAQKSGLDRSQAEAALRRHLGVCLDTCHASVEFESPLDAYRALRSAGIAVPKVQISAGLRLAPATAERLAALSSFDDGVYLHQTVVRSNGELTRFLDLKDAFASSQPPDSEWRVHFHVPIFRGELGVFESTQPDLLPLLAHLGREGDCPHLEVETYTWDVLPAQFRDVPATEAIARELSFARTALGSALESAV